MIRSALILAALAPALAVAADWSQTFVPQRLATHLQDGSELTVMVVAADPQSVDAAKGLVAALRASGRVELVMDEAAIGSVAGLEDAAIVKRATNQPVSVVAIVRVFRTGSEPPMAVVAAYDRGGATSFGFSARLGTPLEASAESKTTPAGGVGVQRKASDAIAQLDQSAVDSYEGKQLGLKEYYSASLFGRYLSYVEPYQGNRHRRELDWPEFYTLAGRKDLADRFHGAETLKATLMVATIGGVAAGLVTPFLFGYAGLPFAAGFLGGAAICYIVKVSIDSKPTSHDEDKQIVEDYNKRLREGSADLHALPPPPAPTLAVRLAF